VAVAALTLLSAYYYVVLCCYNCTAVQADGSVSLSALAPPARDHHGAAYVHELSSLFIHGGRYTNEKVSEVT
jgi:hypothetical protein